MSQNHVNAYDILCTKFGLAAFNIESGMLVEINTIRILIFPLCVSFVEEFRMDIIAHSSEEKLFYPALS